MKITTAERGALAGACEVNDQYLYQVLSGRRIASPELCVALERASGGKLMRWDLRPLDWHRIWPELVGRVDAPAAPGSSTDSAPTEGQMSRQAA